MTTSRPPRKALVAALAATAAALAALGGLAGYGLGTTGAAGAWLSLIPVGLGLGLGLAGVLGTVILIARHADAIERLRVDIVLLEGRRGEPPPHWRAPADTLDRLGAAIADLVARERLAAGNPDARLAAILGAFDEGLLVVTDQGRISLINAAATGLLGNARATVGSAIDRVLEAGDLKEAIGRVRAAGRPLPVFLRTIDGVALATRIADLDGHGGIVLMFPMALVKHRPAALAYDLSLHELPPAPLPLDDGLPLAELPALAIATRRAIGTGTDPDDRLLAVAAVRVHGSRLFPSGAFARLVNPGAPIRQRPLAAHGLTPAMLAAAPGFAATAPALVEAMRGCAVVGLAVGSDLALLRRAVARAGCGWAEPSALSLRELAATLEPERVAFDLPTLMRDYDVVLPGIPLPNFPLSGAQGVLGEALASGEVLARLIARLHDRGITTLGSLRALKRPSAAARPAGARLRPARPA